MATAAELLSASNSTGSSTLVIDNNLRVINIPAGVKVLGVASDDEVLRLNFRIPRYVSDTDLAEFSFRINYYNAKNEGDLYTVNDLVVGSDFITFSWLVGPVATKVKGKTKFNICAIKLGSDGYVDKEYNTTPAALEVLEGLEANQKAVTRYSDVIEQWRQDLFGAGDTVIADIEAASEGQKEAIEDKGIEVLATIPEDYTTTYDMANNAYRTRANAIVSTKQGEIINLGDSSNDPLRGLRVFGKTAQVTTTGKNLLQVTANSATVSGITYTVNPDGTVIASGTSSGVSTLVLNSSFTYKAGVGYTLTGCPSGGGVNTYRLDDVSKIADDGVGGSVVYSEDTVTSIRIRIASDVTVNNLVFKPMIRLTSIEDDTFEPYSGTLVSPSPSWPQPLASSTDPVVKIHNTNIFGGSAMADKIYAVSKATTSVKDENAGTVTYSGGGINTAVLFDNFKPNQQYTLILYGQNTTAPDGYSYTNLAFLYDDCSIGPGNPRFAVRGEDAYCVITSEAGKTVKALIGKWASGSVTIYYDKCGLFEGVKTVADFEPYSEQSLTLDHTIPGIPVSENGNYTDANGQQWICDEIDFERGVYIQRVMKYIPTVMASVASGDKNNRGHVKLPYPGKPFSYVGINGLSSHFLYNANVYSDSGDEMGFIISGETMFFRFTSASDITTTELGQSWMDQQAVNGTPLTVVYALATPIETELTAEELVTFGALHTNYPNTTILNDSGATMEVKYNEDLKFYADEIMQDAAATVITQDKIQLAVDNWLSAHYSTAEGVSF